MKTLKIVIRTLLVIFGVIFLCLAVYVSYVYFNYARIEDRLVIEVEEGASLNSVEIGEVYVIGTYNIGFGAYSPEYSFFMDSGEMLDGTKVSGAYATAFSSEDVLNNTNGSISIINYFNPDFIFFQEVDIDSTRSYHINQFEMLKDNFVNYDAVYSENFHSVYLAYPLFDHHGSVKSGIVTLSNYSIESALRYSLPVDESFPTKFFDLDRCISVCKVKINNSDKYLVLINVHLSAYDEGGLIRAKQLETLKDIMESEVGNYVIIGGDFNHDIANSVDLFTTNQIIPEWVVSIPDDFLSNDYSFATSNEFPTCRSSDISYTKGENYSVVIDGFIVSNNIEVIKVTNVVSIDSVDVSFLYSDHNAVILEFKLKD